MRNGTREMSFAPIGFADDVYSKYCASWVDGEVSARVAGEVLFSMAGSCKLGGRRAGPRLHGPASDIGTDFRRGVAAAEVPGVEITFAQWGMVLSTCRI